MTHRTPPYSGSHEQWIRDDLQYLWHPFTPMRDWRSHDPLIITHGEGPWLIDAHGRRYIDGTSSLWCNVHGHRCEAIDQAVRDQLDRIAHTTLLGLSHPQVATLARRLCERAPHDEHRQLGQVFFSDSGATATELALKMAIGYWHHRGDAKHDTFVALQGAYHGDTTGSMSVGYSELFHRPFRHMVFHTEFVDAPDPSEFPSECCQHDEATAPCEQATAGFTFPSACAAMQQRAMDHALQAMQAKLESLAGRVAAVMVEPLVQGAAGMVVHPTGFLRALRQMCDRYDTLLIADEVATGFGRTGRMFACEHEDVTPDLLCMGKGITGGYLPLAATLATRTIAEAFEGEWHEHRTLYHGHTYTGNPLGCAAANASLDLFEKHDLLNQVQRKSHIIAEQLQSLRDRSRFGHVVDVRQCGMMVGIVVRDPQLPGGEATKSWLQGPSTEADTDQAIGGGASGGDFGEIEADDAQRPPRRFAYEICRAARDKGVIIRPLGHVIVLMPPLAIDEPTLEKLLRVTIETIGEFGQA